MGSEQSNLKDEGTDGGPIKLRNAATFIVNGTQYVVNPDMDTSIGPESLLIDFIRDRVGLKGTKYMCREGGCGACAVTVSSQSRISGKQAIRTVNSCLLPVLACDGMDIKTVEFLGNVKSGKMHKIQKRMSDLSASQCGYCTPGWVMNMYGIMEGKKSMTAKDIEDCMDGNICRCTGYRPILDAMKSLAVDAPEELRRKCGSDIGCNNCPVLPSCHSELEDDDNLEIVNEDNLNLHLSLRSGEEWVKALDVNILFMTIERFQARGLKYRIVSGNTSTGVYKSQGPFQAYVEVNEIAQLKRETVDPSSVILGGAVTISDAIDRMMQAGNLNGYEYCQAIANHWKRVANTPVRNLGTLAGNLMIKHQYREFPSDIYIVLETIGAGLMIASSTSLRRVYSVGEFLNMNMTGKVIIEIHFPKLNGYTFRSFKISRRYQNAHAYVNAGFLLQVNTKGAFEVKGQPRICFGGIAPNFAHAMGTEAFLMGKSLQNVQTIQEAMRTLDRELKPEVKPPDAKPEYLKRLAQSLLYKCILGILGDNVNPKLRSGGIEIPRGVSFGKQSFDTDKSQWPLHQPIPKIESPYQCTGEAEYVNDITPATGELSAAFVLTTQGNADLGQIDTAQALAVPGVVTFVGVKDIPGANNYMTTHAFPTEFQDHIFVQDHVQYAGQPVGVILAQTRDIALKAAKLVKITYTNVKKPIIDIPSALEKARKENKLHECTPKVFNSGGEDMMATHKIEGEFRVGSQYHFHMEPHVCLCVPKEDGMDVFAASQWITQMQSSVADCLGLPNNAINVQVRRLGGGFGGKLARASHVATACAVAANKVGRPVRFVVDLESMMCALGKRHPYYFKYSAEFEDTGKITNLKIPYFSDAGCTINEPTSLMAFLCMQSCYSTNNWQLAPGQVVTNLPPNTYCRAPGSTPGIACVEYIMDHIAFQLKKDSLEVRMANLIKKGDPIFASPGKVLDEDNQIPALADEINKTADLEDRKKFIQNFNMNNRWKKRGLALTTMRYAVHYFFSGYNILISIFAKDGSVSLSHSGIEMGQGINTKAVQVVARELKIPIEKIKVKPSSSNISPNGALTGAAITSEHVCYAALRACKILNERLDPIREKSPGASWEKIVTEAHVAGIDLTVYYNTTILDKVQDYGIWGITALEVEIDVLTGEYKIVRADLITDAGQALSPDVDVGQVEGAFVMGLGMWLTEKLMYNENTGELLTNRTWDYKPPLAKDIPEDFRVTLMRNSSNPHGVLGSKATGEPPVCMAVVVLLALKQAIAAARADASNMEFFHMRKQKFQLNRPENYFAIMDDLSFDSYILNIMFFNFQDGPVTVEDIQQLCLTSPDQFTI